MENIQTLFQHQPNSQPLHPYLSNNDQKVTTERQTSIVQRNSNSITSDKTIYKSVLDKNTKSMKQHDLEVIKALFCLVECKVLTADEAIMRCCDFWQRNIVLEAEDYYLKKHNYNEDNYHTHKEQIIDQIFGVPQLQCCLNNVKAKSHSPSIEILESKDDNKTKECLIIESDAEIVGQNCNVSSTNHLVFASEEKIKEPGPIKQNTYSENNHKSEIHNTNILNQHKEVYTKISEIVFSPKEIAKKSINVTIIQKIVKSVEKNDSKSHNIYNCTVEDTNIIIPLLSRNQLINNVTYKLTEPFELFWRGSLGLSVQNISRITKGKPKPRNNLSDKLHDNLSHLVLIKVNPVWKFYLISDSIGFQIDPAKSFIVAHDKCIYVIKTSIKKVVTYVLIHTPTLIKGKMLVVSAGYSLNKTTPDYNLLVPRNIIYEESSNMPLMDNFEDKEITNHKHAEGLIQLIGFWNSPMCEFDCQMFIRSDEVVLKFTNSKL